MILPHKTHTCMPAVSLKKPRTEDDDGDLRNIHPDQVLTCIIIACSRHRGCLPRIDLNDTIVVSYSGHYGDRMLRENDDRIFEIVTLNWPPPPPSPPERVNDSRHTVHTLLTLVKIMNLILTSLNFMCTW